MIFPGKLSHLGWRQLVSKLGAFSEYCLLVTVLMFKLKNSTDHNDNTKAGCCSSVAALISEIVVTWCHVWRVSLSRCHVVTLAQPDNNTATAWECFLSVAPLQNVEWKKSNEQMRFEVTITDKLCFWAFYSEKSTKIMFWFQTKTLRSCERWLLRATLIKDYTRLLFRAPLWETITQVI